MSGTARSPEWHLVGFDPHRYQAVGFGGRPSYRQEAELRRLLGVHLGRDHAGMFATPVLDPRGEVTGWMTRIDGPIAPLTEAEGTAGVRLVRQVADIRALIGRLRTSERAEDRGAAALLSTALRIADTDLVFAVGTRPCIAGWGFASDDSDLLGRLAGRFTPTDPPPRPGPVKRSPCPPAILKLAILATLIFAATLIWALPWLSSGAPGWHERAGAWEYRGALGAPGRRSALVLGLVLDGQGGAVLIVVTEARPDCRLPLAAEARGDRTLFRPTDRVACASDVPPAELALGCGVPGGGRLVCDIAWGESDYAGRAFIATAEADST